MSSGSANFSYGPPEEEIVGVFRRGRERIGSQAAVAEGIGSSDVTLRKWENEGEGEKKFNAIRYLRYISDHSPETRPEIASLLNLYTTGEDDDPELARWIDILRRASENRDSVMRGLMDVLERKVSEESL